MQLSHCSEVSDWVSPDFAVVETADFEAEHYNEQRVVNTEGLAMPVTEENWAHPCQSGSEKIHLVMDH